MKSRDNNIYCQQGSTRLNWDSGYGSISTNSQSKLKMNLSWFCPESLLKKHVHETDFCSWKSCLSTGSEEGGLCVRALCLSASLETPGWAQPDGTGQLPRCPTSG